jgi:membrane protease YdiL (CAAX protease family)
LSSTLLVCAGCGNGLRASANFCARCGLAIGEAQSDLVQEAPRAPSEAGWHEVRPALQLFFALLTVSFAGMIAYKVGSSPWIDVAMMVADAALVLGFAFRDRRSLRAPLAGFGARPPLAKTALVLTGTALIVTGYFALLAQLGVPMLEQADEMSKAGWPLWTAYVSVAVYPAIFEELAFRGIILQRLQKVMATREAWLVQAGMFSVLHLLPMIFPSHFLLGLAFGWLRLNSGSLYPGMIAHATWNAYVVLGELSL